MSEFPTLVFFHGALLFFASCYRATHIFFLFRKLTQYCAIRAFANFTRAPSLLPILPRIFFFKSTKPPFPPLIGQLQCVWVGRGAFHASDWLRNTKWMDKGFSYYAKIFSFLLALFTILLFYDFALLHFGACWLLAISAVARKTQECPAHYYISESKLADWK